MGAIIEDIFYQQSRLCQKKVFCIFAFSGGSFLAILGFLFCFFRILISKQIDDSVGDAIVAPMFIVGFILILFGLGIDFVIISFKKYGYKIACSLVKNFLYDYPRSEYLNQLQPLLVEIAGSRDKNLMIIYCKLKELRFLEKKLRRK